MNTKLMLCLVALAFCCLPAVGSSSRACRLFAPAAQQLSKMPARHFIACQPTKVRVLPSSNLRTGSAIRSVSTSNQETATQKEKEDDDWINTWLNNRGLTERPKMSVADQQASRKAVQAQELKTKKANAAEQAIRNKEAEKNTDYFKIREDY